MRALTICQPYASLILDGRKRVENRTWETKYRGRIYIHAGKSREWITPDVEANVRARYNLVIDVLPFSHVIGIVTVVDCLPIDQIRGGDHDARFPWLREHEHTEGPWCWVLENPKPVGPYQWKGKLGLFDINPLSLEAVQIAKAGAR